MDRNEKDFTKTFWKNRTFPANGEFKNLQPIKNLKHLAEQNLANVSSSEWKKTKYQHLKYSKSLARRRTFIIGPEIDNNYKFERRENLKSLGLDVLPSPEIVRYGCTITFSNLLYHSL